MSGDGQPSMNGSWRNIKYGCYWKHFCDSMIMLKMALAFQKKLFLYLLGVLFFLN